jgi:hypothetical protein
MKSFVYKLVATNLKSTNPDINSVELFFEDRDKAESAKRALKNQGYECSNIYGQVLQAGTAKNAVDYVNAKIGK